MGEAAATMDIKNVPPSLYVCRKPTEDKETLSCSVAVGAMLELTVYDSRTRLPVAGAAPKRITIEADRTVDWVDCEKSFLPFPVPPYAANLTINETARLKKVDEEIAKIRALPPKEQKKKTKDLNALLLEKEKLLAKQAKRITWVSYLQSGLKLLGLYDGEVDGVMSDTFAPVVVEAWKAWKPGKVYDAGEVANTLYEQIRARFSTDDDGKLVIPLPIDTKKGKLTIEFTHIKVLDPDKAHKKKLFPRSVADQPQSRVDYDPTKAESADLPGSAEMESGWKLVFGKKDDFLPFQNFIEISFKTSGRPVSDPIRMQTLALTWCQPAWKEVDEKFIYDPPTPDHPDVRGYPGRGVSKGLPTLMVSCKGIPQWSKKYGEWGTLGRKHPDGTWKKHSGIDVAGDIGDRVFSVVGGRVLHSGWKGSTNGNSVQVAPWMSGDGTPAYTWLLHLKEFRPKVGDSVKAGDIVGIMGRTGNFQTVGGRPSPTHTHFMCENNRELDTIPSDLAWFAAVFPNNHLPKLLPCRAEYDPAVDAASNARDCNFAHDTIPTTCFAVRELACPFMPAKISPADLGEPGNKHAKIRLQAQLAWLFANKNPDGLFVDPGGVDGQIGLPPRVVAKASAATRTVRDVAGDLLFEAAGGEEFSLKNEEPVANRYQVVLSAAHVAKYQAQATANKKTLVEGQVVTLHKSECDVRAAGGTRNAIKAFRAATTDKGKIVAPPTCYEPTQAMLDELDKEAYAALRPQRPSDPIRK